MCVCVVLWGAYVRATGSGAGCGGHWPLCNGEVVPRSPNAATLIEFTHRATSGLVFIAVLLLLIWSLRALPRRHPARLAAYLSMFFMITEALVGAGLVLFGLVGENDSLARAWMMAFHLINTFLLLACLALVGWWTTPDRGPVRIRITGNFASMAALLLGLLVLGVSGAVAALGDTLFPATDLPSAIQHDFSPGAHVLLQLRVYHPLIAFLVAILLLANLYWAFRRPVGEEPRRLGFLTLALFLTQFGLGITNLLLLAPVWLQILHLAVADLLWIATVLFASSAIRASQETRLPGLHAARAST